ncbi:MAG: hypothetical protein QOE07_1410 [Acidimicrobiaceae bacterium]|nr:hypothetical protein [Acidimicrobiaceae bacterium]
MAFAAPAGAAVARPATLARASLVSYPASPPAQVCGNSVVLAGPSGAPLNSIVIPAGDNSAVNWRQPGVTFWFASGTHTLGNGVFSQIEAPANSTFLGAPGAVIDGQGINRYAFTQTAPNVTIRYLTVQNFVPALDNGVVNHDSGTNWTIQYNTITNNAGAGVMVGPGDVVSYNCLKSNGQYGFNAFRTGGDSNITLDHNEITGNDTGNWEAVIPGCGCTGGGKVWNTATGTITNNWIHNNVGPGIWVDTDNAGLLIDSNYIADNDAEAIIYEISYNAQITNNNILRNGYVEGRAFAAQHSTFPVPAIYISNSGGDNRVNNGLYSTFSIANNNLVDNWGGVTLWEDANRFCGSDLTSTFCTMGNPTANVATCVPVVINLPPYVSDCRWKTQNISVHDNQFSFSRTNTACTTTGCGEQAILADLGTSPAWSPYLGNGIDASITTQQNNHFANNAYVGDWQFAWSNTTPLTFTQWQGGPYNQDTGSTLNGLSVTPPAPGNLVDADTASLEGSAGHWVPWFSATVAQSTAQAQAGSHSLQVNITAPYGWGAQLNNWPGFSATPGPQTMSFWGLAGSGTVGADMQVQWRGAGGSLLASSDVAINTLTSSWQQASADVTAPPGTVSASITFSAPSGRAGVAGNVVFLDQIFVGSTPTVGTNLLDADTASIEASVGRWAPWFSASVVQSTAQAQSGTHSLQVNVTAPYGWGIQTSNWPGFPATAGPKTLSFLALAGSGSLGATMQAQWRDGSGNVLGTSTVSLATLTSTWQQASTTALAPPGTSNVSVTFSGTTGVAGNSFYLDQMFVGSTPAGGVNTLDADTSSLEGSVGHWIPWFSSAITQTTARAEAGTHSLQVNITAPYGWGAQLNNWPGFASGPGPRTISFWGLAGSGTLGATMQVQWRDTAGNVLGTSSASIPVLSAAWQQATAAATAPVGTATATVTFTGTTGVSGDALYLDQIYVGT